MTKIVSATKCIKRRLARCNTDERDYCAYHKGYIQNEPEAWDALEDDEYLDALELLAHFIVFKINVLEANVTETK